VTRNCGSFAELALIVIIIIIMKIANMLRAKRSTLNGYTTRLARMFTAGVCIMFDLLTFRHYTGVKRTVIGLRTNHRIVRNGTIANTNRAAMINTKRKRYHFRFVAFVVKGTTVIHTSVRTTLLIIRTHRTTMLFTKIASL
jgi:hypothetical protein